MLGSLFGIGSKGECFYLSLSCHVGVLGGVGICMFDIPSGVLCIQFVRYQLFVYVGLSLM